MDGNDSETTESRVGDTSEISVIMIGISVNERAELVAGCFIFMYDCHQKLYDDDAIPLNIVIFSLSFL